MAEQPIIIPEKCLGCKAGRIGTQDGTAYYRCGTTLRFCGEKPKVKRTAACVEMGAAKAA